jgi:hypothetical protein
MLSISIPFLYGLKRSQKNPMLPIRGAAPIPSVIRRKKPSKKSGEITIFVEIN